MKNYLVNALSAKLIRQNKEEAREISEWRPLLDFLLDLNYSQARDSILQFLAHRYSLASLAWLERLGERLEPVSTGRKEWHLPEQPVSIALDDERLRAAVESKTSLALLPDPPTGVASPMHLFPLVVGREIRSALLVGDDLTSAKTTRPLSRFCRAAAAILEILRLREELEKHEALERAVHQFNDSVKDIDDIDTDKDTDTAEFWSSLMRACAALMRVERTSLLVFDEATNSLSAKAATGSRAEIIKTETERLGSRIAQRVLESGKPLVVEDVRRTDTAVAPAEWSYQTNSFISCPIMIRGRKIGVLNLTERVGGESFGELDLEILRAIMPQLAVLINSALLKGKAGKFAQLSVTDSLTGLLNRLYLDERLPEEIRRSNREGFPMSFLMIDVDNFKAYNDEFGHTEGDRALQVVAQCLKETLRGADVAVRYGGEEFSILLPQTTSEEGAKIAERIRERVAGMEFPNRQITISVGVASCVSASVMAAEVIKWADEALYEAKRRGRNNVQVCMPESEIIAYGAERRRAYAKTSVANFPGYSSAS
jgi:diguanylate cyclase (GGDEF)-like protein